MFGFNFDTPLLDQINWTHGQKVAFSLSSLAVAAVAGAIAMKMPYIHGIYVKVPMIALMVLAFLSGFTFCFKSVDDYQAEHPDDEDGGKWK